MNKEINSTSKITKQKIKTKTFFELRTRQKNEKICIGIEKCNDI